jgi:hypothetical protein
MVCRHENKPKAKQYGSYTHTTSGLAGSGGGGTHPCCCSWLSRPTPPPPSAVAAQALFLAGAAVMEAAMQGRSADFQPMSVASGDQLRLEWQAPHADAAANRVWAARWTAYAASPCLACDCAALCTARARAVHNNVLTLLCLCMLSHSGCFARDAMH